jgi:hypothetical protein
MIRVLVVLVLIAAALLPPFFTGGACDAEFGRAASRIIADERALASPELAAVYFWRSFAVPVRVISADDCRRSKPDFIPVCGAGDLVYVKIAVHDRVCRLYRDSDIKVRLQYDEHARLQQLQPEMKPYKILRLSWLGIEWFWGR